MPEKGTVRKIIVRIRTCSSVERGAQVSLLIMIQQLITPSYGVSFGAYFNPVIWGTFACERL